MLLEATVFWDVIACVNYSCPDLNSPLVFQKGRLQEILDNGHTKVLRLSSLNTGRLYPQELSLVLISAEDRGGTVVKVLCYKSEGRCFDPRWYHWNFPLT